MIFSMNSMMPRALIGLKSMGNFSKLRALAPMAKCGQTARSFGSSAMKQPHVMTAARLPTSFLLCTIPAFGVAFALSSGKTISNDVAVQQSIPAVKVEEAKNAAKDTVLGQRITYEELTLGSITGLFIGIIIGKLSSVISLLAISLYFFVLFLESRGIVTIPWNAIINVGRERFDVKSLVLTNVGFKISFLLTFVIAAYNI